MNKKYWSQSIISAQVSFTWNHIYFYLLFGKLRQLPAVTSYLERINNTMTKRNLSTNNYTENYDWVTLSNDLKRRLTKVLRKGKNSCCSNVSSVSPVDHNCYWKGLDFYLNTSSGSSRFCCRFVYTITIIYIYNVYIWWKLECRYSLKITWCSRGVLLLDHYVSVLCAVDHFLSFFIWPLCCLSF